MPIVLSLIHCDDCTCLYISILKMRKVEAQERCGGRGIPFKVSDRKAKFCPASAFLPAGVGTAVVFCSLEEEAAILGSHQFSGVRSLHPLQAS